MFPKCWSGVKCSISGNDLNDIQISINTEYIYSVTLVQSKKECLGCITALRLCLGRILVSAFWTLTKLSCFWNKTSKNTLLQCWCTLHNNKRFCIDAVKFEQENQTLNKFILQNGFVLLVCFCFCFCFTIHKLVKHFFQWHYFVENHIWLKTHEPLRNYLNGKIKYNIEWDTGAMYLNMQGQELHKCKTNIIFVIFFFHRSSS